MSHNSILILNITKLLSLVSINLLNYFTLNDIVTLNQDVFAFFYEYTVWTLHEVAVPEEKRIFDNIFDYSSLAIEGAHPIHDFNRIVYLYRIWSRIPCKFFPIYKDLLTDLIDDYKGNFTMFTYNLNLVSVYFDDISVDVTIVKDDITNFVHYILTILSH